MDSHEPATAASVAARKRLRETSREVAELIPSQGGSEMPPHRYSMLRFTVLKRCLDFVYTYDTLCSTALRYYRPALCVDGVVNKLVRTSALIQCQVEDANVLEMYTLCGLHAH
jgi:hypothetical protein